MYHIISEFVLESIGQSFIFVGYITSCLKKRSIIVYLGGAAAVLLALLAIFASNPSQDYALSVDPVLTKGGGSTDTHVTIKNIGRQPLTNVKVDYGGQTKPDMIPVMDPGGRVILSPPPGSDLSEVKVTADDGIDIVQPYRTPVSAPMIGNGGFSQ